MDRVNFKKLKLKKDTGTPTAGGRVIVMEARCDWTDELAREIGFSKLPACVRSAKLGENTMALVSNNARLEPNGNKDLKQNTVRFDALEAYGFEFKRIREGDGIALKLDFKLRTRQLSIGPFISNYCEAVGPDGMGTLTMQYEVQEKLDLRKSDDEEPSEDGRIVEPTPDGEGVTEIGRAN